MKFYPSLTSLLVFISLITASSCSHYSNITSDTGSFQSTYIHTISNESFAPNVHTLFQNQLTQTILKDKRLTLTKDPNVSDTQLFISIKDYKRNVNSRSSGDPGRFDSLSIGISILVSLYDNRKNIYLLKEVPLDYSEAIFVGPSETATMHRETEYQILPKITRELSERLLNLILSDW